MTKNQPRIAIIGAGIGGLAAAAALRRIGIECVVYEQASTFGPVGAGIQLTPNAMKVLKGLGLEQQLRQTGFAPKVGLNREWNTGKITNTVEMGGVIEAKYGVPDLAMHRARLHAGLASLVPQEWLRFGKKLIGMNRSGGHIRLSFEDGEHAVAHAVIGADGLHSAVRDILFGSEKPHFTGKVGYRAVLPASLVKNVPIDERVKWWAPDRHIVSYYTTPEKDQIYFIAARPEPDFELESWSTMADADALVAAFSDFHPQIVAVLRASPEIRKWALFDREPLAKWGGDGIVLLGDACHPMPPYIAQGAATALEDAAVLARCVEGFGADNLGAAFSAYEMNRKPRTSTIQETARQNNWLRQKTDTDWIWAYDAWRAPLVGVSN